MQVICIKNKTSKKYFNQFILKNYQLDYIRLIDYS